MQYTLDAEARDVSMCVKAFKEKNKMFAEKRKGRNDIINKTMDKDEALHRDFPTTNMPKLDTEETL